jgi:hypothetical protein
MHPARHPIAWGQVEGLFQGLLALPAPVPPWPGHQDRAALVSFGEGLSEAFNGQNPLRPIGYLPQIHDKKF